MMKKYLSKRSLNVKPQPMFNIMSMATKLEKENKKKIIHLEIGNTGYFKNNLFIKDLKKETISENMHYVSSAGIYELRAKIAKKFRNIKKKLTFENIVISPANSLITMFLYNIVNNNETVLLLRPYFPTYKLACDAFNIKTIYHDLSDKNDWQITEIDFLKLYNKKKFKAVIINTPSNPSGKLISKKNIDKILKICQRKKIFCLLDYTYHNLIFKKNSKSEIIYNKFTFYIFSYSKDAAIPTLRLGYGLGDKYLINKIQDMNSLIYSCYPANIQKALIQYLPYESKFLGKINISLKKRRDLAIKIFQKSNKFKIIIPDGGIYMFIKILDKINGDDFAKTLLKNDFVCVCPGSSFGSTYKQYFRINLAGKILELKKGLNKIVSFFD